MIGELVASGVVAIISSAGLASFLNLVVSKRRRETLTDKHIELLKDKHQVLRDRLDELAASCLSAAPDNSVRCLKYAGHVGLHSDGQSWWYGSAWFPTQLEEKEVWVSMTS